ncbi:small subunit ribosomal protein S9 [Mycoplasmoides fastidiosum]|uniref:Small ribosomal subunit protein uS9 n=1 Tax=Mycoplasmoides fastidiosum TaxID=92758 RepID=A0ABU0LZ05_9BACT|nr:30S ribosomal protein S9 [Mycoplasmoides fastidiosum]MDQ0513934.1 small subunit ribosomal protein S9 [Mycoplasmoides fastidiosum]UUD37652.1 30S ribosomal protein S9 [Mycoplasmoides fastidiosum]
MNQTKYYGLGRRKSSVAKVFLTPGTGKFTVIRRSHGKIVASVDGDKYFLNPFLIKDLTQPLTITNHETKFDVEAQVSGGGFSGQSGAIRLGVTRALISYNEELKSQLKKAKLTTRDSRCKERKKIGKYGARRSPQFTKR